MEAKESGQSQYFGPYEVVGRPLGSGGMASVYKVMDADGAVYAAKVLSPEFVKDRQKRERFLAEFDVLQKLSAPQIVSPVSLIDEPGLCCIILEYIEGNTLQNWIKKFAPFPEAVVLHVVREISLGLLECHQKGLCHRDLKPENVIITQRGEIKLIDFGIVRDMDFQRTLPGTVLGTVDYMAPEQINAAGRHVNFKADLYSLGVLAWEMQTRRLPISFSSTDSIVEIYEKKLQKEPKRGTGKSSVLEEFSILLMHPNPDERPEGMEEVLDFINDFAPLRKIQRQYHGWLTQIDREIREDQKKRTEWKKTQYFKNNPEALKTNWPARMRWTCLFLLVQIVCGSLVYQKSPAVQNMVASAAKMAKIELSTKARPKEKVPPQG